MGLGVGVEVEGVVRVNGLVVGVGMFGWRVVVGLGVGVERVVVVEGVVGVEGVVEGVEMWGWRGWGGDSSTPWPPSLFTSKSLGCFVRHRLIADTVIYRTLTIKPSTRMQIPRSGSHVINIFST